MKVYLGPYRKWWGPYQIAEAIPFISEDTAWKIGEWLSETWVMKACMWTNDKFGERKEYVRIDKYDTWNMDHTLALIILPMLKQLQATKHGSQWVEDEDLPPYMRHSDPKEHGGDNWVHYKWEWVLNEIIFAFENIVDTSWEEQFHHGRPKFESVLISGDGESDDSLYELKPIENGHWFDKEGYNLYNDRISNGLRLFGKYYRGLWD